MSLSRLSVRRPVAVAMLFLAVVLLGSISFTRLPIDLLPEVSYPRLVVYTAYPEVAPAEIERLVTEPLEAQVATTPRVERVTSVSREGLSLVTLRFAWGTDMDFAMLDVRERLDNVRSRLPDLSERPRILRVDPESDPVLAIAVVGDDPWETKELAESVFRRRFEQLDGVARARVTGGLEREIVVEVDPERLESYGVSIQDVATALDQANQAAPGGTILEGRTRYPLRTLGEFRSVEEIGEVALGRTSRDAGGAGGTGMLRVRDVAGVRNGFASRESLTRYDGREAVGLLVFKESGANTVQVAGRVDEVLALLGEEFPEVSAEVAYSQAGFISDSIDAVVSALVMGGVLAFLVLFLFLREPRYPVAVALAIPISVMGTFALMDAFDVSLNIMSLGGLALGVGMLVDNSIIVLENVFRHREEGAGAEEGAALGAEEVAGAITASTLTTVAVFLPIVYVEGVAGQLFRDLSLAVTFSLLASLFVALTLLPALAARVPLAGKRTRASRRPLGAFDRAFGAFARRYEGALEWALEHRGRVAGSAALALALSVAAALVLPRDLLPTVDQGAFEVGVRLAEGTTLERTDAVARSVEEVLLDHPAVAAVFGTVGRDVERFAGTDRETGLHTGRLRVRLRADVRTDAVVEEVLPELAAAATDGELTVETGRVTALGQILGGNDADIAIRIRTPDVGIGFEYADRLVQRLEGAERLANVRIDGERGHPRVEVEIRRDEVARYGLRAEAVATALEQGMRGTRATEFVDFDRKIPVIVRLPDVLRYDLRTLERLQVSGVPLHELVDVERAVGAAEVRREDQGRVVTVLTDVRRGGLDAAIRDVETAVAAEPPMRPLQVEVGGESEEMRRSFRDLAFAFGLALILVYMILAAQFESFRHPVTILAAVPLALVGAVLFLLATGNGLNTLSLIGMVILVGIVVNDSIVKVDFIVRAQEEGAGLRDAIREAGRVRLRPIVMTTVTTVLGLTPMALGIGRGADLRAPLAVAVIGGLLFGTVLTLIVVPVIHSLVEAGWSRIRAGRSGVAASSVLVLLLLGCGDAGWLDADLEPVVRDSAGVAIMEHPAGAVDATPVWTLAPDPSVVAGEAGRELYRVTGAFLTPGGVVVANAGTNEILFIGPRGNLRRRVGGEGEGPGEFRGLHWLGWDPPGDILAFDPRLRRLSVFDTAGSLVRLHSFPPTEFPSTPEVVGQWAGDDRFLVRMNRIYRQGEERTGVQRDSSTYVVASVDPVAGGEGGGGGDARVHREVGAFPGPEAFVLQEEGRLMVTNRPFHRSTSVVTAPAGFWVGEGDSWEIRLRDREGALRRIVRFDRPNRPVRDADVGAYFERQNTDSEPFASLYRRMRADAVWPEVMPAYDEIVVDDTGRLWIRGYAPRWEETALWVVLGADGRRRARLTLPRNMDILDLQKDTALVLRRDDLGTEFLEIRRVVQNSGTSPTP